MKFPVNGRGLCLIVAMLLPCGGTHAAIRLAGVFGDHMVLQREAPVPIWGWADPGEKVMVEFAGQKVGAVADSQGRWKVALAAMEACERPRELHLIGGDGKVLVVQDVLVGEVWLCSGQSNMEWRMGSLTERFVADRTTADFPTLRQGLVPRTAPLKPSDNVEVKWTVCTPVAVSNFTAVGFYFGRELQRALRVPVGLVNSSWGGSSAEAWTSREALESVPVFKTNLEKQVANLAAMPGKVAAFPAAITAWELKYGRVDGTNAGARAGWTNSDGDLSAWRSFQLKSKWSEAGLTNGGIVWLRRDISLPEPAVGKSLTLDIGLVDEQYCTIYFNGEVILEYGKKPPQFYYTNVRFTVPGRLVKQGNNVLAFRFVVNTGGKQPMTRGMDANGLQNAGVKDLSDRCLVRIEREFAPLSPAALAERPATPKGDTDGHGTSSILFNGMINPLIPYAIKGCIWYQGEANASRSKEYRTLLPLLIGDWRNRWREGDFPFLIQQLASFNAEGADKTTWAEQRESQAFIADTVTNSGMAVGIDIGEATNIHPANKREVGRRLALIALARTYGKEGECSGPVYGAMKVAGSEIRLRFTCAKGLKSCDGQPLRNFAVAGADRQFAQAEARIEGDEVVVSAPSVKTPEAVRYAFINNPEGCNLVNGAGLPARPFRTDAFAK